MEEEKQASSHTVAILEWQLEMILDQIKHQDLKSLITALVFAIIFGIFLPTIFSELNKFRHLYYYYSSYVVYSFILELVSTAAGFFLIFKSITKRKAGKNSEDQKATSKVSIEYGSVVDSFEEYAGNVKDMDLQNYEDQLLWETFKEANLLKLKQRIFNNALYVFAVNLVIVLYLVIIFWVEY